MKARGCLVCFVCALAALALPAAALAKPGYDVLPGSFELTAFLHGHDGFSYRLSASCHHRVQLMVSKDGAIVTYAAKGRVSSSGVEADFGSLGRIDFQIELRGKGAPPSPPQHGRCRGKPERVSLGRFHGAVRFEGEPGVKGLITHRGFVAIERRFRTVCKKRHHRRRSHKQKKTLDKVEFAFLSAKSHAEGRKVEFGVVNLSLLTQPPFSFALIFANVSEKRRSSAAFRAAAPTPSPWPRPGSLR